MFEFLGLLIFCAIPVGVLYLWLRKRKRKPAPVVAESVPDHYKVMLHGHDLSKWNYLGYSHCKYVNEAGETTSEYPIFLFANKKNDKRRSYHVSIAADKHSYVEKYVKPWAAGEGNIYQLIGGEGRSPSDYLRAYMIEHYNSEWDNTTHWWGTSDKAKYTAAQSKQKRERKAKEEKPEDASNVVSVNFGKQA